MKAAVRRWAGWAGGLLVAASAQAGCSRPIEVPLAPIGMSVSFDGARADGVYPQLMRELATSTGCEFRMQQVPRARLQRMFDTGLADMLIPASASPKRLEDGEFLPLIHVRPSILTLSGQQAPRSLAELLARPAYRLVVVRGFSFGADYDQTIATLRSQKRLLEEPDSAGVARALRKGLADGTVMTATIFIGTVLLNRDLNDLMPQLRVDPLEELGWTESGVYLSRRALEEPDRRVLRQGFVQLARSGRVWQLFNDNYPPNSLNGSIRPLP